MDNRQNFKDPNEVKPPLRSSHMQGFQGNGAFYQELAPTKQKRDLRINASISGKTFGRLVLGFVAASAIGLIAAVIVILRFIFG
ncbi:hypothetical protein [Ruminococcus albus]|uniref:hypothetical protein n=1 Tax=Ruminococcus albus TaxID=1264 RepID=UPI0004637241|nr:hypothetical protein [Ruminococcus albus]